MRVRSPVARFVFQSSIVFPLPCEYASQALECDHAALRHRYGGKLGVDATEKSALDDVAQPWPDEIVMSDGIRERVTRRWKEYGL